MGKALQLYPLIYPNDPDPSSFKDRHGVRSLAVQGESQSAATETVEPFQLQKIIEEKGLTLSQVFNCDETGLYWKLMPNKTLVLSREKKQRVLKSQKIMLHHGLCQCKWIYHASSSVCPQITQPTLLQKCG